MIRERVICEEETQMRKKNKASKQTKPPSRFSISYFKMLYMF